MKVIAPCGYETTVITRDVEKVQDMLFCECGKNHSKFDLKFEKPHSRLGKVYITDQTRYLQARNPDTTSIFVEHEGEIKEVSKACIKDLTYHFEK